MSIKLSIKVDSARLRLYLEGDTSQLNQYLSTKYQEVGHVLNQERARIKQARTELNKLKEEAARQQDMLHLADAQSEQDVKALADAIKLNTEQQARLEETVGKKITGFLCDPYNLVWNRTNDNSTMIEFRMTVAQIFTDDSFMQAVGNIIEPLDLPVSNEELEPNMHMRDLTTRNYVTVFPATDTHPELALQAINKFEDIALRFVRERRDPTAQSIPSEVKLSSQAIQQATHLRHLGVFGTAPAPADTSCSTTVISSNNPSINRR